MSCCGNKRSAFVQQQSGRSVIAKSNNPQTASTNGMQPAAKTWPDQPFQHTGNQSPFSWQGPVTGKIYTWSGNGDIRQIDFRDTNALKNHPFIRSYK